MADYKAFSPTAWKAFMEKFPQHTALVVAQLPAASAVMENMIRFSLEDGAWYICDGTKWNAISTELTAGDGINIDATTGAISSDIVEFHGTHDEWDALTAEEQEKYNARDFTDDVDDDDALQAEIEELRGEVSTLKSSAVRIASATPTGSSAVQVNLGDISKYKFLYIVANADNYYDTHCIPVSALFTLSTISGRGYYFNIKTSDAYYWTGNVGFYSGSSRAEVITRDGTSGWNPTITFYGVY